MKKRLFAAVALFALVGAGCTETSVTVTNFEECVAAGNPVMESYPRQCTADGVTYTEDIGNAIEKQNLIRAEEPDAGDVIASPLTITGEARGTWFFEASFPVKLIGEDGTVLAQGAAQAIGEWMTEDFVPFTSTLTFIASPQNATLVLMKDNPSGLPANDDELRIPVVIE